MDSYACLFSERLRDKKIFSQMITKEKKRKYVQVGDIGVHVSSIVKWGYIDNFKPVYFFLRKDFATTKSTKMQNKQLSPFQKFVDSKNWCLFCLVFLCAQNLFVKK